MSLPVQLALTMAAATALFLLGGSTYLLIPLSTITIVLALMGIFKPGETDPRNDRTAAAFCIVIALLPLTKPWFIALAQQRAEAQRARETAPLYQQYNQQVTTLAPLLRTFAETHGTFPSTNEQGNILPLFDADWFPIDLDTQSPLGIPKDPFDSTRSLTLFSLGPKGVLIASVGQDGIYEFPAPQTISSIDGSKAHPLAPLASAGLDLRSRLYDPTNGALANGDLLTLITPDKDETPSRETLEEALKPLTEAWKNVDSLSPPRPGNLKADLPWPPPEADAQTALDLLEDAHYLGSLAASSRAILQRRPHANFWSTPALQQADFTKGRALFELGHVRAAADSFIDYTTHNPNDPLGHYWLGLSLFYGGNLEEARQHLSASYQLDATFPDAANAIALEKTLASPGSALPDGTPFPAILKPEE